MLDCAPGNYGCNGGYIDSAFAYAKSTPIELEITYPYKALKGTCKYNSTLGKVRLTGY